MTLSEIFDATFERPITLSEWGRFAICWSIISAVLTLTGVLAVAIAMYKETAAYYWEKNDRNV